MEEEGNAPGRALDIGCGTGTNVLYLARQGWEAVGVDFAPRAIALAKRRARDADVYPRLVVADATELPDLGAPFDLALDMGCLHSIAADRRERYATSLGRVLRPGAIYLLYAFHPGAGRSGIARLDAERLFAWDFRLARYDRGTGRPSAWYRFVRR